MPGKWRLMRVAATCDPRPLFFCSIFATFMFALSNDDELDCLLLNVSLLIPSTGYVIVRLSYIFILHSVPCYTTRLCLGTRRSNAFVTSTSEVEERLANAVHA